MFVVHWAAKRKKSFDYFTNTFLEFASNVQVSERDYDIMLRLARALTGLDLNFRIATPQLLHFFKEKVGIVRTITLDQFPVSLR